MTPKTLKPNLICTRLENQETIVVDPETDRFYTLSPSSSQLWEYLNEKLSLEEATEGLKSHYSDDENTLKNNVLSFIHQLEEQKLLV